MSPACNHLYCLETVALLLTSKRAASSRDFRALRANCMGEPALIEFEGDVSLVRQVLSVAVRLVGIAVLFIGVWAGVKVIVEAWSLYEQPARIEQFAQAIDAGSNLDKMFASATKDQGSEGQSAIAQGLKLSYFAAWFIALLLLMVVGSLAMSAITTGGRLALYDTQVKKLSRAVIRELARLRPS